MPEQITIDTNAILAWCGLIAAIGIAIGWLAKAAKPLLKPFQNVQNELDDIEQRSITCAKKFANDDERLNEHEKMLTEAKEDNKIIMESIVLLMRHAETGNCTGEVAQGRQALERYLINR